MAKPARFRPGDLVRVIVPRFVVRVGYPKAVADYLDATHAIDEELSCLISKLTGRRHNIGGEMFGRATQERRQIRRIRFELAHLAAQADGFGGRERTLHCDDFPTAAGMETQIAAMKTVKTGTYYGPSRFASDWQGDYEWEPGGLDNMKTHRLAKLETDPPRKHQYGGESGLTPLILDLRDFWIEVSNLEKIASVK